MRLLAALSKDEGSAVMCQPTNQKVAGSTPTWCKALLFYVVSHFNWQGIVNFGLPLAMHFMKKWETGAIWLKNMGGGDFCRSPRISTLKITSQKLWHRRGSNPWRLGEKQKRYHSAMTSPYRLQRWSSMPNFLRFFSHAIPSDNETMNSAMSSSHSMSRFEDASSSPFTWPNSLHSWLRPISVAVPTEMGLLGTWTHKIRKLGKKFLYNIQLSLLVTTAALGSWEHKWYT